MSRPWRKGILIVAWGLCLLFSQAYSWTQRALEWKIRVSAEAASIRLKPAFDSPVIGTLPKGTVLSSTEAEGAWFRIAFTPGKEGATAIGYIATNDVEILEEKIKQEPGLLGTKAAPFRGLGLALKAAAGWSGFSGGDLDRGALGLFDADVDNITSSGYTPDLRAASSLRSGVAMGGDIIYSFRSGIMIGLGLDRIHAEAGSYFTFHGENSNLVRMNSTPWINVFSIRIGLSYSLPLTSWLSLCAGGGPALFLAKYNYNRNVAFPAYADDFYQQAKANGLGVFGSLDLEAHLNPRVSLVLEAQPRYSRVSGFEGSEKFVHEVGGWPVTTETAGTLYYVDGEKYPRLVFFSGAAPGVQNARKAVLDFSGVSLLAGLRFKI